MPTLIQAQLIADVKAFDRPDGRGKNAKRGVHLTLEMTRDQLMRLIARLNTTSGTLGIQIDVPVAGIEVEASSTEKEVLRKLLAPVISGINQDACKGSSPDFSIPDISKIEIVRNPDDQGLSYFCLHIRGSNQYIYLPFQELQKSGTDPLDFAMLGLAIAEASQKRILEQEETHREWLKAYEQSSRALLEKDMIIARLQSNIANSIQNDQELTRLRGQNAGLLKQVQAKDKRIDELEGIGRGSTGERFQLLELD